MFVKLCLLKTSDTKVDPWACRMMTLRRFEGRPAVQVKRSQERAERMAWDSKAEREKAAVLERQVNDLQQETRMLTFQKDEAIGLQDVTDARLRVCYPVLTLLCSLALGKCMHYSLIACRQDNHLSSLQVMLRCSFISLGSIA